MYSGNSGFWKLAGNLYFAFRGCHLQALLFDFYRRRRLRLDYLLMAERVSTIALIEGVEITDWLCFLWFDCNLDKPQPQPTVGQQASRNLLGSAWVLVVMADHLTYDHLSVCDGLRLSPTRCSRQELSYGWLSLNPKTAATTPV